MLVVFEVNWINDAPLGALQIQLSLYFIKKWREKFVRMNFPCMCHRET